MRSILVPTDFSKPATEALARALELAELTRAEIHLLHAYELPTTIGVVDVPLALPQDFFDQLRDAAQRRLDELVRQVSARGFRAHAHLVCEAPTRAILEAAEKVAADLI